MEKAWRLQDGAAARCWVVVCADLVLVAINIVDVAGAFPLVVHLGDGDKFNRLSLENTNATVTV